eukprot:tig00020693_g13026.t1
MGGRCNNAGVIGTCTDPFWSFTCNTDCSALTGTKLNFTGGTSDIESTSKAAVATDGSSTIWTHGGFKSTETANFDTFAYAR